MKRLSKKSSLIAALYNSKWQRRLLWIFKRDLKILDISIIRAVIEQYKKEKNSDEKIINQLRELVEHPENQYNAELNEKRAQRKVSQITPFINKPKTLLDYGGNVGYLANELGKYYNIPSDKRHVIDLADWSGQNWKPLDSINFIEYNPKGYEIKADLITSFHVLHHIKDKEKIVEAFDQILSKNGQIVLYEHDCWSRDEKTTFLIDLEHCLFDVVVGQTQTFDEFIKDFYASYMSIKEWKSLFGDKFICYRKKELRNANSSFMLWFGRSGQD